MEHGGFRPGAGRPRGSESTATRTRRAAKLELSQKVVMQFQIDHPDGFQGDSIDFLRCIYKNPTLDLLVRIDAAKAASRFERPALQAVLTKDVSPMPTTPGGINDAIELLMRKGLSCEIDGSGASDGAGEPERGGSSAIASSVAGEGDP